MELCQSVLIQADPETILDLAFRVERWPDLLPHYRWVRVLEERPDGRVVRMAARRGPIPMAWTALQWKDDRACKVFFRHLGGPARGMDVVWNIEERAGQQGQTKVSILHDLSYPVPVVGPFVARFIVGALFIQPTASRTLGCFKRLLEKTEHR